MDGVGTLLVGVGTPFERRFYWSVGRRDRVLFERLGLAGRFREPINLDLLVTPVATAQKGQEREKDNGRSRYRTHAVIRIELGDWNRANALDNYYDRQR